MNWKELIIDGYSRIPELLENVLKACVREKVGRSTIHPQILGTFIKQTENRS